MTTKKLLKFITLAGALLAGLAVHAAGGHIFEIRPCSQVGVSTAIPYRTIDNPLMSGETVYFNVRLIRSAAGGTDTIWYLEHGVVGSEEVDKVMNPLQIGIYVSGEKRYADLISATPRQSSAGVYDGFTDLVFAYKTRAGDFALPIVLAMDDGSPASDSDSSSEYDINYRNGLWKLTNAAGGTAKFAFWSPDHPYTEPESGRNVDYSLSKCGFYVKTIDFDSEWEVPKGQPGELWRSVHQNSTICGGALTPKLVAAAAPEDKVTLHVWSKDESCVRIKGGRTVDLITSYEGTEPVVTPTQVGDVVLAGGQMTANFQIEGVGLSNTCSLVLSAWDRYNYVKSTGQPIVDYITVPVKSIEPMPPTAVVEVDRLVAYANGNYMTYGALLTVYLSQAYDDGPVTVKVTPGFSDGATADWGDYVRFSTTQDEVTTLPAGGPGNEVTVTIPAGSTARQQIYAFFLRGDVHTTGSSRLVFTPSIDDATVRETIRDYTSAGLEVRAEIPVIATPSEGANIVGICGDNMEFTVAVEDTFADISDDETGYRIFIKYRAQDAFKQLPGVYYAGEGGVLYQLTDDGAGGYNKTTDLPVINYPGSGEGLASQIYVVSPVSGKKSEVRSFTADIKEARTSNVSTTDGNDVFYEGEQASFQVRISEKNDTGSTIYAFLLASDNAKADMFSGTPLYVVCNDSDYTRTKGLAINPYQDATSPSKIMFLDGLSEDGGGLSVTFQVVLCSSETYDPTKKLAGYDSNYLNVTVYNREPTITRIEMNGFPSENDGYHFDGKIPKGMTQSFKAIVADKGRYDLNNTTEPFQCKWTASLAGVGAIENRTIVGNPADNPYEFSFPRAGEWTIKLQVKDKDMDDWSEVNYSVVVTVLNNPVAEIIAPERYLENDPTNKVQVQLSYWDTMFTGTLRVKVTVSPYDGARPNPGFLELDTTHRSSVPGEENVYYVDISDDLPVDLMIDAMDGTPASATYGFVIKAEVVSETILDTSHTRACDYYIPGEMRIWVDNVAPECIINPQENTNRWSVSGSATSHPINWTVSRDVDADFTGIPGFEGIKVTFLGCDNATSFFVTEPTSGQFIPNFGSAQGDVDLTLIIEDKDNGMMSWTWQYEVTPSKMLKTGSNGPSDGTSTSQLSRKYSKASGRGAGHTYVSDGEFMDADNFLLRWNMGSKTAATIYGFGYKVGALDNGALNGGRDQGIESNGRGPAGTGGIVLDPFAYDTWRTSMGLVEPEDEKDSFFYCWILQPTGEGSSAGGTDSILGGTLSPERPGAVAHGTVSLPTEKTGDGNYLDTIVEAVFSLEWRPGDNLGDINQDGIPDYYALKDDWANGKLIQFALGLDDLSGDLLALNATNPDDDYLPGVYQNEDVAALVDGAKNSWAPIGPAFLTIWELRGFGEGLNDPDGKVTISDVDLSDDEKKARDNWFAAQQAAGNPAVAGYASANDLPLTVWSPEPGQYSSAFKHMDPTTPDTDVDNLSDGWEYYIWYQAHVTYWADAKYYNHQVNLFERFNPAGIITGVAIDPAEVEALFNPLIPRTKEQIKKVPDTDKDGLSDYEEYLIGTNPCHWDTDGDHMADGWEVMVSLNPLDKGDRAGNPDGDFFAVFTTMGYYAHTDDPNAKGGFDTKPGEEYQIDLSGRYLGSDGFGVYWDQASEAVYDEDGNLLAFPTAVVLKDFTAPLFCFTSFQDPLGAPGEDAYRYGLKGDLAKDPLSSPTAYWGYFMAQTYGTREVELHQGDILVMPLFTFIHDQVRDIFGFDPRTGWYKTANGYVANRWDPSANPDLNGLDATGVAVNTEPYVNYDEYMLVRYRQDLGKVYPLPPSAEPPAINLDNMWASFRALATNPNVPKTDVTVTENVETAVVDPVTGETNVVTETQTSVQTVDTPAGAIAAAIAEALHEAGNKAPTLRHGADSDGDGVPDGWELYTFRDPCVAFGAEENPMMPYLGLMLPGDLEDDGLTYAMEYAGTDSCNAYRGCESIYKNHPGNRSGWFNKFLPTNPGFQTGDIAEGCDTDEDGIADSLEGSSWAGAFYNGGNEFIFPPGDPGFTFVYGPPVDDGKACIRGGGLNPLSCDTDLDGLPDPWEMQYAGVIVNAATKTYAGPADLKPVLVDTTWIADGILNTAPEVLYIAGGQDGTWGGDGWTDPSGGNSADALLGTVRDVDFDHDGLQNWQEYLVQQVRHFRYDDITTPLMGRQLKEGQYQGMNLATPHKQQFLGFVPMAQDAGIFANATAAAWYGVEVLEVSTETNKMVVTENPYTGVVLTNYVTTVTTNVGSGASVVIDHLTNAGMFQYPWTASGWEALGYMTMAHHSWDRSIAWSGGMIIRYFMYPGAAGVYVSTDPRMSDTDLDGMDDYYEMFHGLNPILGTTVAGDLVRDIICAAYGAPDTFNAYYNEWTHPDFNRILALMMAPPSEYPALSAPNALDPVMYPWTMGAFEVDADGDGLRNHDEALLANVTSPTPTHTDPSPLWFTDSSTPKSYVSQYYSLTQPVLTLPYWPVEIGFGDTIYPVASVEGSVFGWAYPFEENEGYDTDGDWLADQREIVKTMKNTTDPLLFADPVRRQAAYFDGTDSFMMTRELQYRSCDAEDFFKQFTAECWVRPESTGRDQTILERSSYYGGDAVTKLGGVIRANFRIGLSSDGRVYGMFDNTDSIESGLNQPRSCQRVDGGLLPLGKWTHVALTYDGHWLVLYVNGESVSRAETSLMPANGVVWLGQNVGNSGAMPAYEYEYVPTAFFVGARPQHFAGADSVGMRYVPLFPYYVAGGRHYESFDNYREFFHGYVDEIRLWDGARKGEDILQSYRQAMTFADVAANRQAVYESWAQGNLRNDNYGPETLPPELIQHYSFTALPGAVDEANVAKVPFGFDQAVEAAAMNGYNDTSARFSAADAVEPLYDIKGLGLKGVPGSWDLQDGIRIAWWDECLIHSRVYDDTRVVPWVQNTVAHLPMLDGSCLDSFMYSDDLGAQYQPATASDMVKYVFPNTATPYQKSVYDLDRYQRMFCHDVLTNQLGAAYAPYVTRYQFEVRDRAPGTSDLLPMGHAFAKTCPELWDGAVADAWEVSGTDDDDSGIPDWWEEYARQNYCQNLDPSEDLNWDTAVIYNGVETSAWEAYLIDLSRGLQPDFSYDDAYASTIDADNDSLPDWWENLFGIAKYGALDDPDHDGLSNYAEWRITYGPDPFGVRNGWPILNPNLVHTDPDFDATDYFITVTNEPYAGHYLGEIVTDHDFMEDFYEPDYGTDRNVYDPYSDNDEDGWTAWSELRYAKFKASTVARLVSHIAGDEEIPDSPVPAVHLTIRYNGEKLAAPSTVPIVVEGFTGNNLQKQPNATFVINPGVAEERFVNLGTWEDRVVHGTMTPGFVKGGLDIIKLQQTFVQSDGFYSWRILDPAVENEIGTIETGDYTAMRAALTRAQAEGKVFKLNDQDLKWVDVMNETGDRQALQVAVDPETQRGHLLFMNERVGEIDLLTGDFTFDMAPIGPWFMNETYISLKQGFYRIAYTAQVPTLQSGALTVSLANADTGALMEGVTAFTAFADLDGNNAFDPATEPIGFVRDVEVGWDRVPEVVIEMTDSAAAGVRFAFDAAASAAPAEGEEPVIDMPETIRIIRTAINGNADIKRRIVFSRNLSAVERKSIWDGDFITGNKFGLDWAGLRSDILADETLTLKDVKSVGYTIVSGEGSVLNIDPAAVLGTFTIEYVADAMQSRPTAYSPSPKAGGIVETAQPTFKWTAVDGYTAFRLQIADADGAVVYSSDLATVPPRDASGRYCWTAPVYVGLADTADDWTLANNTNYSWRVAMYNPKFSETNDAVSAWSDWTAFRTAAAEVNDFTTSYGTAKVEVRYYGPATNLLDQVIVALYRTADFSGTPAAEVRLADVDGDVGSLTNGQTVTFIGLASGDYYAAAWIDRNGNAKRERYETWGYYNQVGRVVDDIYTPRAIDVNADGSAVPSVKLYLEDTDLNQNKIVDALEEEALLASAEAESSSGADTSDADGDGLTADEETSDTYTDPSKFDTDGDGLPDGWEAKFADTDPLNPDADTVIAGDVMAYAEVTRTLVTDVNGLEYLLVNTNAEISVGDDIPLNWLAVTYSYGDKQGVGTNLTDETTTIRVGALTPNVTNVLIHAQVYDAFGFDSQTATANSGAPNTKPFTALDKYLVVKYLEAMGLCTEEEVNRTGAWSGYTLRPGVTDLDRDGLADGWELYVMFGPNGLGNVAPDTPATTMAELPISPWNYDDARSAGDFDGDTLTVLREYAFGLQPSDPWDRYSVLKELFKSGLLTGDIADFDYLDDATAKRFGISADEYYHDLDLDQVHNLGEMLGFYYDPASLADIDVKNAWSNGATNDYFRTFSANGEPTYLGRFFNGGEFIEIDARDALDMGALQGAGTVSLKTGWDYWSAARYGFATVVSNAADVVSADGLTTTQVWTVENDWSGKVMPTIDLTLKYADNEELPVVIEAYQVNPAYPERGEALQAVWSETAAFSGGIAHLQLAEPVSGSLKQGKATFRAYIPTAAAEAGGQAQPAAQNGEEAKPETPEFSYDLPYGVATTDIGWKGGELEIGIGDPITALPIIPLSVDSNTVQLIAIVRTKVNGQPLAKPRGVMLRRYWNNVSRDCIFPNEYCVELASGDNFIGLDKYLIDDYELAGGDVAAYAKIESVTYEIVRLSRPKVPNLDDGDLLNVSVTNLNHYTVSVKNPDGTDKIDETTGKPVTQSYDQQVNEEFTVNYALLRDKANVIVSADSLVGDTDISFTVPTDGFPYTRFWLEVDGVDYGDEAGFLLSGVAQGLMTIDLEEYMGEPLSVGEYEVRILLGNDKFGGPDDADDDEWSEMATVAINAAKHFAGSVAVEIRHPLTDFAGGLTLAVYEGEDLVNPLKTFTGLKTGEAVTVDGLRENGEYYVAAWYVKNEDDGRLDATERKPYDTWGYVTSLGLAKTGFDPLAVIAAGEVTATNVVWLQDTDWNDNGVIDREEDFKAINGTFTPSAPDDADLEFSDATETSDDEDGDDVDDSDDPDPVFDNGDDWIERDVMAYEQAKGYFVYIGTGTNKNDAAWYWVSEYGTEDARLSPEECPIRNGVAASDITSLVSTYLYGAKKNELYGVGTNVTFAADSGFKVINSGDDAGFGWKNIVFVHAQVYSRHGFNPNTANGYIGTNDWVNTKKYTSKDKSYTADYLLAIGAITNKSETVDGVKVEYGKGYKALDRDMDGVLDGWELYVMFGDDADGKPAYSKIADAPHSPWCFGDREADVDGDGLNLYREYDGGMWPTDPFGETSLYDYMNREGMLPADVPAFTDTEIKNFVAPWGIFRLKTSGFDVDQDLDLITGWQEMLAYLYDKAALGDLCITNAWSDGDTPDYFRAYDKAGVKTYLGESYNGAEFIEPFIRPLVIAPGNDRAGTRDFMTTGWDNWSTARYSIENAEGTLNISGVVSDELMLLIRYWNVIRPGEFTGTTVGEAVTFFHTVWAGVIRLIDDEGNVLIEAYEGGVAGPGTIHDADAAQTTTQILDFFGGQKKVEEVIALNKKNITADEIETPEPEINLVVKYAGNESYNLVLSAYQVNPAYPEYGEQMTAQWTMPVKFDSGVAKVNEIRTPSLGSLKQGPAKFVAFIDMDGDNALSAADTFGSVQTVVGYKGCDLMIRLGESNPALPIIELAAAANTNATAGADAAAGGAGEEPVIQTIAIVRSKVNGAYVNPRGVSLRKYDNNVSRTVLFPDEFVGEDFIGLDPYLADDITDLETLEEVTYEVVKIRRRLVSDEPSISVTNLNHYTIAVLDADGNPVVDADGKEQKQVVDQDVNETFTVKYSITRDVPLDVSGFAGSKTDDTIISFSVPTDRAVTKFWLEIDGSVCASPGDRGFLLLAQADGRVILDQRWFVENNLTDLLTVGSHRLRVGLGNDKFPGEPGSDEEWSAEATFGIAAEAAFGGKLAVKVAHPAVDAAEFAGKITVAVYEKSDLAVQTAVLTGLNAGETIEIGNLRVGANYYVAAWCVKDEEDGRVSAADRLPYDTWGYLTAIGRDVDGFMPLARTAEAAPSQTNTVWMQDTDWNDNGLIDREEDLRSVDGVIPSSAPECEEFSLSGANAQGEEDDDGDDVPEEEDEDPVFDNGDEWIERDVMAYYQTRGYLVYIACTNAPADGSSKKKTTGEWYWLSDYSAEQERLSPNECPVRNGENAANLASLKSTYVYSSKKSNTVYGIGTNVTFAADAGYVVVNDGDKVGYGWNNIVFVHAQVYSLFGFNSATANGYIPRGEWVNTKAFTQADKTTYVVNYLLAVGAITNKKDVATLSVKKLDNDADGVLDGWELYTMFGDDADGEPAYSKIADAPHSPWNIADRAFDADADGLTLYQEYDGGYHPTDPFDGDTNGDGITDAMAFKYHIKDAGMLDDQDGDGLNNYVEYLLSEVFDLGVKFDPDDAYSVNDNELDYFYPIGSLYVGEIFTDFDMIEDTWEDAVGTANANRYAWDALADNDDDGWGNFDECRSRDFSAPLLVVTTNGNRIVTNEVAVTGVESRPRPTLTVAFTYGGKQPLGDAPTAEASGLGGETTAETSTLAPIVLQTYTGSDLMVADATYSVIPQESLTLGRQTLTFTDAVQGHVKGGDNVFVAFVDRDGDGKYTVGEPMGMTTGVKVGFTGADTAIELTDVSPIITRVDLSSGETDRHVLYGTEDGDYRNLIPGSLSGGTYQRVRIVRTLVNGWGIQNLGVPNRVLFDETIELEQRPYLFEGDLLKHGEFDIDWSYFESDVLGSAGASSIAGDPVDVTYRIVLGNGSVEVNATNNLFEIATVRHFDAADQRQRPVAIAPGLENAVVYGSRPTFKWTMNGHNSYTAFKISVMKDGTEVWNSGFVRTPPCSSEGIYSYTPGIYVGDLLANNQNYTWKVSMYNSKFKRDFYSSETMTFRMNAPTDGGFYGKIPVCVKYFGPATAINGSTVYVEAFTTPDFTGDPVARAKVSSGNLSKVTEYGVGVEHKVNVNLLGLTKGQYYIRAYLDSTKYGTRYTHDDWESWGYLCGRERDLKSPFKPIAVNLTDATAEADLVVVYIEDADTNGNKIPDSYEMAKYGTLNRGAKDLDKSTYGGVALNSTLAANLASKAGSGATGGLVAQLPFTLSAPAYAAMALDVAPEEMVIEDGMIVAEPVVEDGSLVITSIRIENGEVVLDVAAETKLETGVGASFYELKVRAGATVTARIFSTETTAGEWKLVAEQPIVISGEGVSLRTPVSGLSVTGELYKVEIVQ